MAKQRASPRKYPKPDLGESWVVESDGDDNSDDNDMSRPSTALDEEDLRAITSSRRVSGNEFPPPSTHTPGIISKGGRSNDVDSRRTSNATETPRRRSNLTSTRASVEPEFIMPSIHEKAEKGSWTPNGKVSRAGNMVNGERARQKFSIGQPTFVAESASMDSMIKPIFRWAYDVLGQSLGFLKTPVAYILTIWILIGMFIVLRNILTRSVHSALSPICRIPGSSLLNLEMCHSELSVKYTGDQGPPAEFEQLMNVQSKFENIMEESAGGVSLPLDLKRSEASLRDLRQIVKYSSIHSKNELVLEFDGFIETARIAGYDLTKFNSHVGRAVDQVLATARWTQRELDSIAMTEESKGSLTLFLENNRMLAPFRPMKFAEDKLLDQYIQHTRVVEEEIHRLLAEAQGLIIILANLEDRLDTIHGITIRDNIHASKDKNEVMAQLWTKLGGNRMKLGKFQSELALLKQVGVYRQSAFAHVAGTIVKLQAMDTELKELRERVANPELLRDKRDVPLSVHIENIQLGLERLENVRGKTKMLEAAEIYRRLDPSKQTLIEN